MMARPSQFISEDTFVEKAIVAREEAYINRWTELLMGEIFKITDSEEVVGKFGPSYILTIINEKGQIKKLWAPKRLNDKYKANPTKKVYFTSLGQISQDNKKLNDFDIVIED